MNNKFYYAKGTIKYKKDGWCICECPMDIILYYKWWVEKFLGKKISTSFHSPHITLVAGKYDNVSHKPFWGTYHNKQIEFIYYSHIFTDAEFLTFGKYFWLRVDSPIFREIRVKLGLKPEPFHKFHLTVGYCGY